MHSLLSFTDSIEKTLSERRPLPKPKPAKPPRKNLPVTIKNIENTMDTVTTLKNRYDVVEVRKDAWKTQGISEVNHKETVDDLEEYISWGKKEVTPELPTPTKSTKIIPKPIPLDLSYDRLQFFGSTSKLNIPGYKQVAPLSLAPTQSMPSWSDYDEVEVNMQPVRLADDSHLGYGMIRKATSTKENSQVTHQVFNDNVYAVVSKPKQV